MIMVAPTGARRTPQDHPALPITLEAILETASSCYAAGADTLHLHVRDELGAHSLDAGRYREALDALASAVPSMRVQITTESASRFTPADQLACLQAVQPTWASVSVREIAADPATAARLYRASAAQGTDIQHILYSADCIAQLRRWQQDGTVDPSQNAVIHVLGSYAGTEPGKAEHVAAKLRSPDTQQWMICAFGPDEHACLAAAHRLGGDIRVGFENSLGLGDNTPDGHRWQDNAESVAALKARLHSQKDNTP